MDTMEQRESVKEHCEHLTEKVSMDNTEVKKQTVGENCHKLHVAEQQPGGKLREVSDKMYMYESQDRRNARNADNFSSNNQSIAEEMLYGEKSLRVFEENNEDRIQQTVQDLTNCLEQKKNLELLLNSGGKHSLKETKSIDTSNGRNSDGLSAVETPTLSAKLSENVSVIPETLENSGSSENLQNENQLAVSSNYCAGGFTSSDYPREEVSTEGEDSSSLHSSSLVEEQLQVATEFTSSYYPRDGVSVEAEDSSSLHSSSLVEEQLQVATEFTSSDYPRDGVSTEGEDSSSLHSSSLVEEQLQVATANNQVHDLPSGTHPDPGSSFASHATQGHSSADVSNCETGKDTRSLHIKKQWLKQYERENKHCETGPVEATIFVLPNMHLKSSCVRACSLMCRIFVYVLSLFKPVRIAFLLAVEYIGKLWKVLD